MENINDSSITEARKATIGQPQSLQTDRPTEHNVQGTDSSDSRYHDVLHGNPSTAAGSPLRGKTWKNHHGRGPPSRTQDQGRVAQAASNRGTLPGHRGCIPERGYEQANTQYEKETSPRDDSQLRKADGRETQHDPPVRSPHVGSHQVE